MRSAGPFKAPFATPRGECGGEANPPPPPPDRGEGKGLEEAERLPGLEGGRIATAGGKKSEKKEKETDT